MVLHTMDLIQFHSGCVSGGLSPYLKFGCLSVKTAWHAIDQCIRGKNHSQPPQSLHGQMPGPFFHGFVFVSIVLHGFVYGYVCSIFYGFHWFLGFLMIVCVVFVWFYHVSTFGFDGFVLILSIVSWCCMVSSLGLWMLRACSVSSGSSMAWMPDLKSMG
jgi:hypothetical protein